MTIWDPVTTPVDYINLAGKNSPGIAEVTGAADDRDLLVQQPAFTTGARILYRRRKLAEFTVTIRLYTAEDHAEFDEWRKIVDAKPTVRAPDSPTDGKGVGLTLDGLEIWHPLLVQIGVGKCVVKKVSQLVQSEDGVWSCTIDFIEYIPFPKQSLAKIERVKESPADPVDARIDQNNATLSDLAGQQAGPIRP